MSPAAFRPALAALACLVLSTAMAAPRAGADALYTVRNLGVLPGGLYSKAMGLNDRGQVIGISNKPAPWVHPAHSVNVPVVFEPDGTIREVDVSNPSGRGRLDLNDSGRIAEGAEVGVEGSFSDINNRGQIAGSSRYVGPGAQAPRPYAPMQAVLVEGSQRTYLGTLGGPSSRQSSYARGINEAGHVVGQSQFEDYSLFRAFLYRDGEMIDLTDRLGGAESSYADAINDRGQILGGVSGGESFLLDGDELTLFGGPGVNAMDLNNQGDVVGLYERAADRSIERRAFLFRDDTMLDLNDLIAPETGWTLNDAYAINDLGQVVGSGTIDGVSRAFLLTPEGVNVPAPDPIPEPAPIALLGLAAGWAMVRRRRAGR
ncbi:HAF repeat-containing PEP-CTERM protein [Tautonia plasticadhaerens]|uniref:PEP-CTERM protein-sorting domain-containing protein n=1 Tax=Tautonia plasticadhaerens TaxID=2527974 RepID=A0A518H330_9BACT|nr:HAF repeat-containing PEP-CTERM protein [Tautonia plasticadhaerens]QDV35243.1 hypothetical protein ElP_31460 [Tautonia plasticadhaerens]